MKKVLFATSALVLAAGFASAEVAVSGDGRMGFIYDGEDMQFSSRARVKFTLTGETDSGLSFGGEFRADNAGDAKKGTAGHVWISGTYGKLAMGDVASAAEEAIGDLYSVGYTDTTFAGDVEEIFYLTADGENTDQGPNALYSYSINGFNLYASMSDGSAAVCTDGVTGTLGCNRVADDKTDMAWSLAANYDLNGYKIGLGYSKHGDAEEIVLGGEATFNEVSVKAIYADYSDRAYNVSALVPVLSSVELDRTFGLSAKYDMANGVGIQGFWRRDEVSYVTAANVKGDEDFDSFGIGASYDLGGGATLAGGIVDTDYLDDTVADFGIKFKF
ncbi:porin [Paracoccus sp. p1-h21]|uniref:porin n=1 Tax=Paracoccus sp. p1-h21 TaxID=3366951 RepID=UPI003788EE26